MKKVLTVKRNESLVRFLPAQMSKTDPKAVAAEGGLDREELMQDL